jgi:hypothetical protein
MTRTGKIARLSREIRTQLNRRLRDGESGRRILEWLNALPEVRALLQRDFDGRDITDQNLYEWKQGGYPEWLAQQEALAQAAELAANAGELAQAAPGRMSDHLATVLIARYAAELAAWGDADGDQMQRKLRALHALSQNVVELRRGDHEATRLEIEQTRLDREREKTEEETFEYFRRWLQYPKVLDSVRSDANTPEDQEKLLREVFGRLPGEPETRSDLSPLQV